MVQRTYPRMHSTKKLLGLITMGGGSGYNTQLNQELLPDGFQNISVFRVEMEDRILRVRQGAPQCAFCGRLGGVEHMGKFVCNMCLDGLKKLKRKRR